MIRLHGGAGTDLDTVMKIAFLVQGLFEKSDSIGYDCVYEYQRVKNFFPDLPHDIRIFAERFDTGHYAGVPIEGLTAFHDWCRNNPDGTVIYHYCGAWREMDEFLVRRPARSVIRWHNNTSPWFYFSKEAYLVHTIEGFDNIVDIADKPNLSFWVNSSFTRDQFIALGGQASRSAVVFPASRYLEKADEGPTKARVFAPDGTINMLFVGRVVQHKGHKAIIAVARRVHETTGWPVTVRFAGREDDVKEDIAAFAQTIDGVETIFCGEVSEAALEELYRISDVFLCLSEHEGFGLPVFEAMRCGLPTVVWSTTALRELMVDHPFGFHLYDLNMFAAAVVSLRDDKVYRAVLDAQRHVLATYKAAIVDGQIRDALSALENLNAHDVYASLPTTLRAMPQLAAAVAGQMQKALSHPTETKAIERDGGYNLFSRYDIETFRMLFDRADRLRFAPFENIGSGGGYRIAARDFRHKGGEVEDGCLSFPWGHYPKGHLIFGPYIELPPAHYVATFDLSVRMEGGRTIEVDVASVRHGTLARRKITLRKLDASPPSVAFEAKEAGDTYEFRVKFPQGCNGELTFRGVSLGQGA